MLLVDFRSRMTVYVNWSWAWFTYGRGARLLVGPGDSSEPLAQIKGAQVIVGFRRDRKSAAPNR